MKTKLTAFIFGDISGTVFYFLFADNFSHELIKGLSALLVGVLGGIGGLFGKDAYKFIKSFTLKNKDNMKSWISKNKVLVAAIVSAWILVLQQALSIHVIDWKAIGLAGLYACVGVIANQWKGKGLTIVGILGTLAGTFQTLWTTGTFTWNEFILSGLVTLLMTLSGSLVPERHEDEPKPNLPYSSRL